LFSKKIRTKVVNVNLNDASFPGRIKGVVPLGDGYLCSCNMGQEQPLLAMGRSKEWPVSGSCRSLGNRHGNVAGGWQWKNGQNVTEYYFNANGALNLNVGTYTRNFSVELKVTML
jgi:hypothetical protein